MTEESVPQLVERAVSAAADAVDQQHRCQSHEAGRDDKDIVPDKTRHRQWQELHRQHLEITGRELTDIGVFPDDPAMTTQADLPQANVVDDIHECGDQKESIEVQNLLERALDVSAVRCIPVEHCGPPFGSNALFAMHEANCLPSPHSGQGREGETWDTHDKRAGMIESVIQSDLNSG